MAETNEAFQIELTEAALDMKDIFNYITTEFQDAPENCPMIVVVKDLPDGKTAVRLNGKKGITRVILLKEAKGTELISELYRELKAPTQAEDFPEDCAFFYEKNHIYDLYLVALDITTAMEMICPQLIYTKNMPVAGLRTLSVLAAPSIVNSVFVRESENLSNAVHGYTYELRHTWQHQKHEKLYYADYRPFPAGDTDEEKKAFMLQKAEVDAEAFSMRYLSTMLNGDVQPNKPYEEVNRAISDRKQKMAVPY